MRVSQWGGNEKSTGCYAYFAKIMHVIIQQYG